MKIYLDPSIPVAELRRVLSPELRLVPVRDSHRITRGDPVVVEIPSRARREALEAFGGAMKPGGSAA